MPALPLPRKENVKFWPDPSKINILSVYVHLVPPKHTQAAGRPSVSQVEGEIK